MEIAERGIVPTSLLRFGIRSIIAQRLREASRGSTIAELVRELRRSPVAIETDKANEQHYEVPAEFFQLVLGPSLKYSGCFWPDGTRDLGDAELRMLQLTCERAVLADGQHVLELGCGWGSLALHMARSYPNMRITAVSNSATQRRFIEARAPENVRVITADMNDFDTEGRFDRVVSVEMFEHMRNYEVLLRRIRSWLKPTGRLFVHVFCHRKHAYPFETAGATNWMGRHFFTGGLMPSLDLLPRFDRDLVVEKQWEVEGTHYSRTARAWRERLELHRESVLPILAGAYDGDGERWYQRWRLFFLACEELFGYAGGREWLVAHYFFAPRPVR